MTKEDVLVVIFSEGLCRIAEQYLKKGSKVYLEGALQTRKWQDKEGKDRYSTEVVLQGFGGTLTMLDGRSGGAGAGAGAGAGMQEGGQSGYNSGGSNGGGYGDAPRGGSNGGGDGSPAGGFDKQLDDEIPF